MECYNTQNTSTGLPIDALSTSCTPTDSRRSRNLSPKSSLSNTIVTKYLLDQLALYLYLFIIWIVRTISRHNSSLWSKQAFSVCVCGVGNICWSVDVDLSQLDTCTNLVDTVGTLTTQ